MIKQNKFFAIVFINLMLISAFCSCGSVNALDYVQVETVYTDAGDMLTRFSVWALSGEISADGTSFGASCTPALTHYSEYEYYTFVLYVKDNPIVEISVPDTYMGIDVELWDGSAYVLRTGNAALTLSAPYNFNSTSAPPADWGSMPLAMPSGYAGSLRRVILAVNNTALGVDEAKLRITNYYATSPAVGFDGVNDYVSVADDATLDLNTMEWACFFNTYSLSASYGAPLLRKEGAYLFQVRYTNNPSAGLWNNTAVVAYYAGSPTLSRNVIYNYTGFYNGSHVVLYLDGVAISTTARALDTDVNTAAVTIGMYGSLGWMRGAIYNLTLAPFGGSSVLSLNASSFSGSSITTVVDFSGAGNHGTAYGNVQYKANLINGYQLTYITLVANINVNETVINWYGEMEVLAALVVVLAFFIITLFAYYKMQNSTMVLLSAVFALMVNVLSLSSGIPFSPFPQLFLSIVELMLLVYARRMNI